MSGSSLGGNSSPSLLTSVRYMAITNSCRSRCPSLSMSDSSHIFLSLLVCSPVAERRGFAPAPETSPSLLMRSNWGL